MFDIGFVELLICGVIALIVLGPERLPTAARAAGRWVGKARRMVGKFSSELDRQLKAEELREELRKAGDVGLEDVQKTVRGALDEAKKYEHMIRSDVTMPTQGSEPANPATAESEKPEPDEDPASANNSGHSSLKAPEGTPEPQNREPGNRT